MNLKMVFIWKLALLVVSLYSCNCELEKRENENHERSLNYISETSKGSRFNIYNLPDFVGFSYSRASVNGPKNRFINFEQKVEYN